jgi:hypothetical protein
MPAAARQDLRGFGYLPGHYNCRCIDCPAGPIEPRTMTVPNIFTGAKGSYRCETHATAAKARHDDETKHATEVAREGLAIHVPTEETGGYLRIVSIRLADFGQTLHIEAITKGGERELFKAARERA